MYLCLLLVIGSFGLLERRHGMPKDFNVYKARCPLALEAAELRELLAHRNLLAALVRSQDKMI